VRWDESKDRGVAVEVRCPVWGFGYGEQTDKLEEICRRGGALGLAGKVWAEVTASR
jgi:hypothetical protein